MDDPKIAEMLSTRDETIDAEAALVRFRAQAAAAQPHRRGFARGARWLAAAAAIALLFAGFSASGLADTVLKIFEPSRVATVQVGRGDFAALKELGSYGTVTVVSHPSISAVDGASAASERAGVAPLHPTSLPASVIGAPAYGVVSEGIGTFTFDAELARSTAVTANRTLPPMPADVDGTTLTMTQGPSVVQTYGVGVDPAAIESGSLPTLVIVRGKVPMITSNGATVDELRGYLLAQPGMTPQLAAQIRAFGDPSATLPIPIPVDAARSETVTLRGTSAVLIGDSTGLGSGVIWVEDGTLNFVGGTLTKDEVLQVAGALR